MLSLFSESEDKAKQRFLYIQEKLSTTDGNEDNRDVCTSTIAVEKRIGYNG